MPPPDPPPDPVTGRFFQGYHAGATTGPWGVEYMVRIMLGLFVVPTRGGVDPGGIRLTCPCGVGFTWDGRIRWASNLACFTAVSYGTP